MENQISEKQLLKTSHKQVFTEYLLYAGCLLAPREIVADTRCADLSTWSSENPQEDVW